MRRIEVTASTLGQVNPSPVTLSGGYHYKKDPEWYPNHPAYREDIPRSEAARKVNKSAAAKAERFREFTRLRGQGMSVTAAGREVRVGSSAARDYERERKAALAVATEAAQEGGTP